MGQPLSPGWGGALQGSGLLAVATVNSPAEKWKVVTSSREEVENKSAERQPREMHFSPAAPGFLRRYLQDQIDRGGKEGGR